MKVLYFSQYYLNKGGAEKNILQLIKAFHNNDDLFLAGSLSDSFRKEIRKLKIKNLFKIRRII
ncbi:MAG: hypothetical protein PHO28_03220 [Candidatus Pacebacteria bacterium]|nr:hypothetical protein [Candidatus Paceibacterota bacterium]